MFVQISFTSFPPRVTCASGARKWVNDDETNEHANWIFLELDDQSISVNDFDFPSEPYQTLERIEQIRMTEFRRQFRIAWSIDGERLSLLQREIRIVSRKSNSFIRHYLYFILRIVLRSKPSVLLFSCCNDRAMRFWSFAMHIPFVSIAHFVPNIPLYSFGVR